MTRAERLPTGVRNLDGICDGGLVRGSLIAISGPPGSGKTILAQQICFHNAALHERVLYFGTLSEPTAKLLRNLKQFSFFQPEKLGGTIEFVDLGEVSKADAITEASALITSHLKRVKPTIIVIDSFKAFDDLARSQQELRSFGYEIAVTVMAWEATTFLLGEFGPSEYQTNPLFSIVDGICVMSQREVLGEHRRLFQVVKMRGTSHSRDEHPFAITHRGIDIFAASTPARRDAPGPAEVPSRLPSGVPGLDPLLGGGLLARSITLVSGSAGIGKTTIAAQFLLAGVERGELGLCVLLEDDPESWIAAATALGLPLGAAIDRGDVHVLCMPRETICVGELLTVLVDRLTARKMVRVVIDAVTHLTSERLGLDEQGRMFCKLAARFKALGVTCLFTLDAASLYSNELVIERSLSPLVDNLVMLRYREACGGMDSMLTVVKTRGSEHDRGTHRFSIGHGGVRLDREGASG